MFRKYQAVEKSDVLSKTDHTKVESHLKKMGKTSVADLDEDERVQLSKQLEKSPRS